MKALFLFPPNWTACVPAPHLALPLMAGCLGELGYEVQTWDLSSRYYSSFASQPRDEDLIQWSVAGSFTQLDGAYFQWEDEVAACSNGRPFNLMEGFSFPEFDDISLTELLGGEVQTPYRQLFESVLHSVANYRPAIIGVTVATERQFVAAVELLRRLRTEFTESLIVLGGNYITRIRSVAGFNLLHQLADIVVTYQGERALRQIGKVIASHGVAAARSLPKTMSGNDRLDAAEWPLARYEGINWEFYPGIAAQTFLTTRGCYWGKCPFCAIPAAWSAKGFAGSLPAASSADQMVATAERTGVRHCKIVDEALSPSKAAAIGDYLLRADCNLSWECYSRLESSWLQDQKLERSRAGGLRKIYFGLEQASEGTRGVFGKSDSLDACQALRACRDAGILVHLFCMVGHPGTSIDDAKRTVDFLLHHQDSIDTADLVAFRLDAGTTVEGTKPLPVAKDWAMSIPYLPLQGSLSTQEVALIEAWGQEQLWQNCPRLLHPLYRCVSPQAQSKKQDFKEKLALRESQPLVI